MSAIDRRSLLATCVASLLLAACQHAATSTPAPAPAAPAADVSYAAKHAGDFAVVPLTADLSTFDDNGKHMIALLVQAAEVMDDLYWRQSWPDKAGLLARAPDAATRNSRLALCA